MALAPTRSRCSSSLCNKSFLFHARSSPSFSLLHSRSFASSSTSSTSSATSPSSASSKLPPITELRSELREVEKRREELREAIFKYRDPKKKHILILGAGRSATACINYLLERAERENWDVKVGDGNETQADAVVKGNPHGVAFGFDANDERQREKEIGQADVVVSLLPAFMHPLIAKDCLRLGKHMVTASYVSKEMKAMANEAKAKDLLFLNEVGVDPGIDHMITMRVLDEIRSEGAELKTFQSFTGGLVAPESDNNPWHYKFSWNPRNVVLAGQGTSMFVQNGQYKYIPYQQVFRRYEELDVPNYGSFEGYANRDSLKYRATYGIEDCPTVFRGTLRRPGFCEAWDTFVQLGMTDDTYEMENVSSMTHRDFINSFLMWRPSDSVELKLAYHLGLSIDSPVMQKLKWLGIFENRKVGLQKGTPAQILQAILEKKWGLKKGEKDMVVMYNQFIYENKSGDCQEVVSTMVAKGDGTESGTAMARTVGLPLAIATKLVVNNQLPMFKGVHIPTHKEIYAPILNELEKDFGIEFTNQRNKIYRVKEDIHL